MVFTGLNTLISPLEFPFRRWTLTEVDAKHARFFQPSEILMSLPTRTETTSSHRQKLCESTQVSLHAHAGVPVGPETDADR